jgi:hypothetical protein
LFAIIGLKNAYAESGFAWGCLGALLGAVVGAVVGIIIRFSFDSMPLITGVVVGAWGGHCIGEQICNKIYGVSGLKTRPITYQ